MATLEFFKYQGTGNDFIVVEATTHALLTPAEVAKVCERRFGVGADGVLLVLPPSSEGALKRMRVINADGSVPEMCGNGLRCVALHVALSGRGDHTGIYDTDAGQRRCTVTGALSEAEIAIEMGVVRVGELLTVATPVGDVQVRAADVGNPHAVIMGARAWPAESDEVVARAIQASAAFPEGTNVEFIERNRDPIAVRVFERGVGWTLACGTGACAVAGVLAHAGDRPFDEPMRVALPGGRLTLRVEAGSYATTMRGPARRVFKGSVEL